MSPKRLLKIILWILVGLFFIIGIPAFINGAYKYGERHNPIFITLWDAPEVLAYYGTILAAVGAILGVYFSVKAAHRNYEEDVRTRMLPFIAVTLFERKTVVNTMALLEEKTNSKTEPSSQKEKPFIYEEFKLDRIYFIITSDGIETKRTLEERQQDILSHAGTVWTTLADGAYALHHMNYFSIPIEIENVGNGTAVALRIGFNRISNAQPKYIHPMMLKQGQTIYIHIFSEEAFDIVRGEYALEFYYEDIHGNRYSQKFPVSVERDDSGKEYYSVDLDGKQIRQKKDVQNTHNRKERSSKHHIKCRDDGTALTQAGSTTPTTAART